MNDLDTRVLNAAERLELAVKASTDTAIKLLKCAESISNPVYSITMDGQVLEILAVSHFAGQINIQVKSPFAAMDAVARRMLAETKLIKDANARDVARGDFTDEPAF